MHTSTTKGHSWKAPRLNRWEQGPKHNLFPHRCTATRAPCPDMSKPDTQHEMNKLLVQNMDDGQPPTCWLRYKVTLPG